MSTLAEVRRSEQTMPESARHSGRSERLVDRVRAEFLELPGLSLTLAQAARLFGVDTRHSKRLLKELLDEGFLVCDGRGAFRRRDVPSEGAGSAESRTRSPKSDVHSDHHAGPGSLTQSSGDLLDDMGVELPCLGCNRRYCISLRQIRLSHLMIDAGCPARHFADCPPAAFAHLIDPAVLAEFEDAAERIEAAAEGAGGRLVVGQDRSLSKLE